MSRQTSCAVSLALVVLWACGSVDHSGGGGPGGSEGPTLTPGSEGPTLTPLDARYAGVWDGWWVFSGEHVTLEEWDVGYRSMTLSVSAPADSRLTVTPVCADRTGSATFVQQAEDLAIWEGQLADCAPVRCRYDGLAATDGMTVTFHRATLTRSFPDPNFGYVISAEGIGMGCGVTEPVTGTFYSGHLLIADPGPGPSEVCPAGDDGRDWLIVPCCEPGAVHRAGGASGCAAHVILCSHVYSYRWVNGEWVAGDYDDFRCP